ncbi:MAG: HlyD family efflux transporter periplasmic adaptor subunit [Eubacteriales bacterium]
MAKSRVRLKGRFFMMILILMGFIALVVIVANALKKTGEIEFGSLGADLEVNAAIIRDEKVIMSEPYEKITFDVVEGETVNNDQVIAQLYKRGYQDETMVTLLNLQKQIYDYQMQLLGGQQPQELIRPQQQHRRSGEADSPLCPADRARWIMLDLEQTLKDLENQRVAR